MRRSPAILLVLLISGCAGGTDASAPSSIPASATPSEPASSSAPDVSRIPPIDAAITEIGTFPGGWSTLMGAAPLAHGSLWVSNGGELGEQPRLRRVDTETLEVTAVIDLGGKEGDAYGAARSVDGIWVPLGHERAVVLVDPATNAVTRRIEVDANPYGLFEDGDDLWITDFANSEVLRIDLPSGEERLRVDIPDPTGMVAGPEGVWVVEHMAGFVTRIDPETGDVLAHVDVGGRPCLGLGLGSVWSGSSDDGTVARIDPARNEVVATIQLPEHGCGGVVAAGSVWVAAGPQRGPCERTSYLLRIDPGSNEIDGILSLPCVGIIQPEDDRLWLVTWKDRTREDQSSVSFIDLDQGGS
jgi:DNA-binding beta-propeller fold protein YncE